MTLSNLCGLNFWTEVVKSIPHQPPDTAILAPATQVHRPPRLDAACVP